MREFRILQIGFFDKKTTIQPLFTGLESPLHPSYPLRTLANVGWGVTAPRGRQGTTDVYHMYQLLSEKIAMLDDLETAQSAMATNLRSTILSNYFFTESGGGTFSPFAGML